MSEVGAIMAGRVSGGASVNLVRASLSTFDFDPATTGAGYRLTNVEAEEGV